MTLPFKGDVMGAALVRFHIQQLTQFQALNVIACSRISQE